MNGDKKEETIEKVWEKEVEIKEILLEQLKVLARINKNTIEHFEGTLNEPEQVAKNASIMIDLAEFILYR